MTQQGNRVPDASADEQARAAATEDYGGVPISDSELADVWLAEPDKGAAAAIADADTTADTDRPEPHPSPTEPTA